PRIAMVVDGEVVSAPMLDQAIPGGAIEIAGWDGAGEFVAQATGTSADSWEALTCGHTMAARPGGSGGGRGRAARPRAAAADGAEVTGAPRPEPAPARDLLRCHLARVRQACRCLRPATGRTERRPRPRRGHGRARTLVLWLDPVQQMAERTQRSGASVAPASDRAGERPRSRTGTPGHLCLSDHW